MSKLEQLQVALDACQGEASSAMMETKLTQEKLQDALSSVNALTRERDEMEAIAERTHGDLLKVLVELDAAIKRTEMANAAAEWQRARAETAEKERDALLWESDDGICGHCGEGAVRVSIDTTGYPYELFAVRYCPVCHNAWVREEPVNPDASQL